LDRYILAKTRDLIHAVQSDLDQFDSYLASSRVREFAEVLTNWYIRRSRDRFWSGDKDAFDTLYTVLEAVFRTVAPLLPIISEEMWRGLTGGRSVHLESWPDADEFPANPELVRDMDAIREAASVGLSLRKGNGLRVRLPLSELTIAVDEADSLANYSDLIADELNVKKVTVVKATEEVAKQFGLTKTLSINARALGPRLGKAVQEVIQKAKAGDWKVEHGRVTVGETVLEEGEYELALQASSSGSTAAGVTSGGFVLLDLEVTKELEQEGIARDAIRHIQQARKDAGLDVSDRISLKVFADSDSLEAISKHREFVCEETLATAFEISEGAGDLSVGESGLIKIELAKQ
jgi:isoleucyl-tRNA synthetase